jgi:hypothetical protein
LTLTEVVNVSDLCFSCKKLLMTVPIDTLSLVQVHV